MQKIILGAASYEKQKYYLEPKFSSLPQPIQEDIRRILVVAAQKNNCAFAIGFYENGQVYIETIQEDPFQYDEIGAELTIKEITTKEKELFQSLSLWYKINYLREEL